VSNYIEIGDWEIREPQEIQKVLERTEELARGDKAMAVYYLGAFAALRWVLCATTVKPLPIGEQKL
jgi:hypothetical protein